MDTVGLVVQQPAVAAPGALFLINWLVYLGIAVRLAANALLRILYLDRLLRRLRQADQRESESVGRLFG